VYASLRPGLYGYGGVQARGKGGDTATFSTVSDGELGRKVSRFELFYQRFRGAGSVELKVDGKRVKLLETRGDLEDAWEVIEVPDGAHALSLRVVGSAVRLYGVTLERTLPGVVYDSLGLVGARADRLLNSDRAHLQAQIAHRAPDLLVLGFGGNESANKWLNIEQYQRELTDVVQAVRGGQRAMSCLLLGPLDQAERDERGRIVTVPVLPKIVDTQRRVALQQGCAFFDAYAAMGGSGSISKWLKKRPRLATSDLRHATPAGYDVIGDMYYKALLKAFAAYLSTRGKS
jgi:lysophospholipase L1-like esterase